jgi:hypothetical protein
VRPSPSGRPNERPNVNSRQRLHRRLRGPNDSPTERAPQRVTGTHASFRAPGRAEPTGLRAHRAMCPQSYLRGLGLVSAQMATYFSEKAQAWNVQALSTDDGELPEAVGHESSNR